ncbi:DUF4037 domain-containing protein [Nocardioides sp.]|uniref:DUF4037 domain-containing protein n=1 Tax=Nocardioides sp. TaxID=35761 RepID=UPI002C86533A|nr:DUF4037 domain-containing protein [Nocardioides sp.]HXH81201.1 DUF4037 domain-containing protein [Nocardioides sp.]
MQSQGSGPPDNGLQLSQSYWEKVVAPILDENFPGLPRAAARIGTGSEVLGLDDHMSRDHDWGLRLQVFVPAEHERAVRSVLSTRLPTTHAGWPTRFVFTGQDEPVLGLEVLTVDGFAHDRLGFDPRRSPSVSDWLSVSGQAALEVTRGRVFKDSDGSLSELRAALAWYPDDVWRYVIASGWQRIDQELPLMGRAGDRGDDMGSRIIAARLVDAVVHLAFLLGRRWAPYSKWRGTAFEELRSAPALGPILRQVLVADDWHLRNEHLCGALEHLLAIQADSGLPVPEAASVPFWDRPYSQVHPRLVSGLVDSIRDPLVRALPVGLGSIEQCTDNVDLLVAADRRHAVARAFAQPS